LATPQINWLNKNLADFVPGLTQAIAASGVTDVLTAYGTFKKLNALLNASKFTGDNTGSLLGALTFFQTFVSLIDGAIGDFVNSGVYFMLLPPAPGGIRGFQREFNNALLNSSDPYRPVFSSTAEIAAVGAFAFALDNRLTELAFQSITKAMVTKPEVARALGVEQMETSGSAPVPHLQNILASTARPVVRTPWIVANLHELLPGIGDLLLKLKAMTTSLLNTTSPSSVKNYLDFADRQVDALQSIVKDIQNLLDFIKRSFDFLPLHFFSVDPVVAGTADLAAAVEGDFFDPVKHPVIADANGSYFTTGFVMVMGSDLAPASVHAKYNVLRTLFHF